MDWPGLDLLWPAQIEQENDRVGPFGTSNSL